MRMYGGIDLHSNNSYLAVIDETDRAVFERRLPDELGLILRTPGPCRGGLVGIAVESIYNWYWLVDGLTAAGSRMHLANPGGDAAVPGPEARRRPLKRAPAGPHAAARRAAGGLHIYPAAERGLRDLLRQRHAPVQQKARALLAIGAAVERTSGRRLGGNAVKRLDEDGLAGLGLCRPTWRRRCARSCGCCAARRRRSARWGRRSCRARPSRAPTEVCSGCAGCAGSAKVLATTIALEMGDIHRAPPARRQLRVVLPLRRNHAGQQRPA